MKRPKIAIPLDIWDRISEVLSGVGLIIMILIPAYYYSELPDTIPHHFNAAGEPDAFGHKSILWTLPGIGIILYTGLTILNRYPHIFNYAVSITEKNALKQYRNATKMLRSVKLIVVYTICFINYIIVQTSLEKISGLPLAFMVVFPVVIIGTILYYVFRSMTIRE